jgi:hypothetical protein
MSITKLINDYINGTGLQYFRNEIQHYRNLGTLEEAINDACFGRYIDGNKVYFSDHYMHAFAVTPKPKQWNIGDLYKARDVLFNNIANIRSCADFATLYQLAGTTIRPLQGIGDLLQYDIMLRIGAYLNKMPQRVYAQRGALYGAGGLFNHQYPQTGKQIFDYQRKFIQPFPDFKKLAPYEAENFLCVYEHELQQLYI